MLSSISWIKSKAVIGVVLAFIPRIAEAAGVVIPPVYNSIMDMIAAALGVGAARNWILQSGSFKKPTEVKLSEPKPIA